MKRQPLQSAGAHGRTVACSGRPSGRAAAEAAATAQLRASSAERAPASAVELDRLGPASVASLVAHRLAQLRPEERVPLV